MRYDERVIFIEQSRTNYNPKTSKHETKEVRLNPQPCNFSALSPERTALEFGDVLKDINVVRINYLLRIRPTHLIVRDVLYIIKKTVMYRHDTVFYVEEVVNSGSERIKSTKAQTTQHAES